MSTFDELKTAVNDLRKDYNDFKDMIPPNDPVEKIGSHQRFTAQEALFLFEEQLRIVESVLEDKAYCVRYVPETDMRLVTDNLVAAKIYMDKRDLHSFTSCTENMISPVRSFAMLKMDSKWHHETQKLKNIHNDVNSKLEQLSNLIQERSENIAAQEAQTKNYEKKLEEYESGHKETIDTHNMERDKLLKEVRELISSAEIAVQLKSAEGLSGSFLERERKMGDIRIKMFWILVALIALVFAVVIGLDTVHTEFGLAVIPRTLMMAVAIGGATFAAKQYSQNKSIELDYGYKAALVRSYPGLAKEFQKASDKLRVEFVIKLLDEVLQDPQRNRNKGDVLRSSTKTVETQKVKEIQKQAEPLMPKSND